MKMFKTKEELVSFYFKIKDKKKLQELIKKIDNKSYRSNLDYLYFEEFYNQDTNSYYRVCSYKGIYKLILILERLKQYRILYAGIVSENTLNFNFLICRDKNFFELSEVNVGVLFNEQVQIMFCAKNNVMYNYQEYQKINKTIKFNKSKFFKTKKAVLNYIDKYYDKLFFFE